MENKITPETPDSLLIEHYLKGNEIALEYIINKWQQYKRKNISPGTIKEMQTIFNNYCEYYNRA